MIKSNPNHKKAFVENIKKISKASATIGLSGMIGISSVLIYSGLEEDYIRGKINENVTTSVGGWYNDFDILSGNAKKDLYDKVYEEYKEKIKEYEEKNNSEKHQNEMEEKKDLIYDETLSDSDTVELDPVDRQYILNRLDKEEDDKITIGDLKLLKDYEISVLTR